jgi:hypothetical protein
LPTFNIINNNNKNKNSYLFNGKIRSICGKGCEIVPVLRLPFKKYGDAICMVVSFLYRYVDINL